MGFAVCIVKGEMVRTVVFRTENGFKKFLKWVFRLIRG